MSEWSELKTKAKGLGINTHGMKKPAIEAAIIAIRPDLMSEKDRQTVSDAPHNGMRDARPEDREPTEPRKIRVPLGVASLKLKFKQREGYHRHIFNDVKNRLHDAELAGYTYVEEIIDERGTRVSRRVGVHDDMSPMFAFLMEIRQELYDEDEAGRMAVVDEIDAAITRPNQPNDGEGDGSGFYTPSEGTSISPAK